MQVTVTVTDNGPGIPPDLTSQIFQDGFTTKTPAPGRRGGLGLALVHRLVVRLHGSIEVSEGPGAQFTVRLPKEPAATTVDVLP
jgi:two-component system CitB family sensor kinase